MISTIRSRCEERAIFKILWCEWCESSEARTGLEIARSLTAAPPTRRRATMRATEVGPAYDTSVTKAHTRQRPGACTRTHPPNRIRTHLFRCVIVTSFPVPVLLSWSFWTHPGHRTAQVKSSQVNSSQPARTGLHSSSASSATTMGRGWRRGEHLHAPRVPRLLGHHLRWQ